MPQFCFSNKIKSAIARICIAFATIRAVDLGFETLYSALQKKHFASAAFFSGNLFRVTLLMHVVLIQFGGTDVRNSLLYKGEEREFYAGFESVGIAQ